LKKTFYHVLFAFVLVLLLGALAGADYLDFQISSDDRAWPQIFDVEVEMAKVDIAGINLDSMNASLAANNFAPIKGPVWGYTYGSYIKRAPHNRINFGMFTSMLQKTTANGSKKAKFNLITISLQLNKDYGRKAITFTPKVGIGLGVASLHLTHKKATDIYAEPREVIESGYYLNGMAGFDIKYNFDEVFSLAGSAEYFGGYKLYRPIQDLDMYHGYKFGLGLAISLP